MVLDLEFVKMSELRADILLDEPIVGDTGHQARRTPSNQPVTDIKVWLDCYSRMAALLCTQFLQKAPEVWAYQATAHNYEASIWIAYNHQLRRDMLAQKDLNWSTQLYNKAFTGRAKSILRCMHCLCEDHSDSHCLHNPSPMVFG